MPSVLVVVAVGEEDPDGRSVLLPGRLAQLGGDTSRATASDPALITELPCAPEYLHRVTDTVKENLYVALGIQCLYRRDMKQVTIRTIITNSTITTSPHQVAHSSKP